MLNALVNLIFRESDSKGIVKYVRTEWGNETKHLSDSDCIGFYDNYLTTNGRVKR